MSADKARRAAKKPMRRGAARRGATAPIVMAMYDVIDDNLRARMAACCFDHGLQRVQLSVYLGRMAQSERRELIAALEHLAGAQPARLLVMTLPSDAIARAFVRDDFEVTGPVVAFHEAVGVPAAADFVW